MRTARVLLGTGLITAMAATAMNAATGDAIRCSIMPFSGGRASGTSVLLAVAAPDTVAAGAGLVEPSGHGGHVTRAGTGPVFGQVLEVDRHAGADSVMLAGAFDRSGTRRIVIVPWDYDAECQPVHWGAGAVWVRAGEPGVFTVRLRPDSLWADGVPTFDAFMANFEPYPGARYYRAGYRGTDSVQTTMSLTAAEYFDLLLAIPLWDDANEDPDAAWAMITGWQAAHPELAGRYPATRMISSLGRAIASLKARRTLSTVEPVIAGTWRFAFSMDDAAERTFYARTRRTPTTDWRDIRVSPPPADPAEVPPRPDGYHLIASGALTSDSLLTGCGRERVMGREGYIAVLEPAPDEQRREWQGLVDLRLLERQFPGDAALRRFARAHMMEGARQYREGFGRSAPARFTLDDDGVMRVRQTMQLDDGSTVELHGERVATAVIDCDG